MGELVNGTDLREHSPVGSEPVTWLLGQQRGPELAGLFPGPWVDVTPVWPLGGRDDLRGTDILVKDIPNISN